MARAYSLIASPAKQLGVARWGNLQFKLALSLYSKDSISVRDELYIPEIGKKYFNEFETKWVPYLNVFSSQVSCAIYSWWRDPIVCVTMREWNWKQCSEDPRVHFVEFTRQ